ncbi:hypothetical protein Tco_0872229 [Tanacetum coccineum]
MVAKPSRHSDVASPLGSPPYRLGSPLAKWRFPRQFYDEANNYKEEAEAVPPPKLYLFGIGLEAEARLKADYFGHRPKYPVFYFFGYGIVRAVKLSLDIGSSAVHFSSNFPLELSVRWRQRFAPWHQADLANGTPMNRDVQKFNQLVSKTLVMSRENDEDWMMRVEILFRTHTRKDFKHNSAWLFLKDKHKWKNLESTLARRNRLWVTDEEPEHFREDALPRPPGAQRIAKSQRSSNSIASSGSNPVMYQEIMKEQYELDRKKKMEVIEQEANSRTNLYNSQKIVEDMRVLQIDSRGIDPTDAAIINAQKARV